MMYNTFIVTWHIPLKLHLKETCIFWRFKYSFRQKMYIVAKYHEHIFELNLCCLQSKVFFLHLIYYFFVALCKYVDDILGHTLFYALLLKCSNVSSYSFFRIADIINFFIILISPKSWKKKEQNLMLHNIKSYLRFCLLDTAILFNQF